MKLNFTAEDARILCGCTTCLAIANVLSGVLVGRSFYLWVALINFTLAWFFYRYYSARKNPRE